MEKHLEVWILTRAGSKCSLHHNQVRMHAVTVNNYGLWFFLVMHRLKLVLYTRPTTMAILCNLLPA